MTSTKKKRPLLLGSGGGDGDGSKQVAPTEERDSLRSTAYGRVLDLLCEGEIEGLVDGYEGIYLNETQVETSSGYRNFSGVTYETVNGTQSQSPLGGFQGVESSTQVVAEVKYLDPYVITITNPDATAVRITMGIPQLSYQDPETGNISGYYVDLRFLIQSNGGGYVVKRQPRIKGKSMSRYQTDYTFRLPAGGAPWDIRVERYMGDSTSSNYQNRTFVDGYTEIIDAKFKYPNSALIGLRFDATQFQSIPSRAYLLKLLKIRLPSNSTTNSDGSLSYSGTWDGTFRVGWSSNPAWCFYDLITNERYGLGREIDSSLVDKWSLYAIGRYCDERVNNGEGGLEPRFSCNVYIQTREEAFKVIQDMASVFRAMTYWADNTLTVVQDAPADPVYLYTPANVIEGNFTYSGASLKARHTVALVSWNDPDDFYRQKIEYVEDTEAIARFGILETEVYAFGCTSRGQANRLGRWLLYTERYESESVSFRTGIEGAVARPGQIIQVADPVRAGTRLGGRVVSATTTEITVDSEITANMNGGVFYCLMPDGSVANRGVVSVAGSVVTLSSALDDAPVNGAIWLISTSAVEAQTFRVLSVTETDDGFYEITAISHNPDKFDAVEDGLTLEPRSISQLSIVPSSPQNVSVTESLYQSNVDVKVKLTVSWQPSTTATSYLVQYREENGNWLSLPETSSNDIDVLDVSPGIYEVSVVAVSAVGKKSAPTNASIEVFGKLALPGDVEDFSLIPVAGSALLSWTKSVDLDVLVGGTVRIRWTPLTTGQEWVNAVDIVQALPGSATQVQAPLLAGTYMAKFYDSSLLQSETEALIVTTVPEGLALNVVDTVTESPSFSGTKTDCEVLGGGLTLTSNSTWDDMVGTVDEQISIDTLGGFSETATYLFAATTDLSEAYTSRVTANIQLTAYAIDDYIDARETNMDSWSYFDGPIVDDVFATLYMRTTTDDPSGSPVWTVWKPFVVGEYLARGFQFQLKMGTADTTHNLIVTDLSITIDMPDRVVNVRNQVSGTTTYTVTYAEPFYETPAISITAFNMGTGDYYTITSSTASGFQILFKNSGGTNVSRTFDVLAKGFGRKVVA